MRGETLFTKTDTDTALVGTTSVLDNLDISLSLLLYPGSDEVL